MKKLLFLSLLLMLVACEDRYRYFCQDPKNFQAKRCQKPDCQFTQDCPEYLVAPVLEKKIESTQSPTSSVPNN
jgi:hypothetical protein